MKGKPFAGCNKFGGGKAPFTSSDSNITQDKATVIGGWTVSQIIWSFREGKRSDGTSIGAPMAIDSTATFWMPMPRLSSPICPRSSR